MSPSPTDNAAILASGLTSLTGSKVITQSDYLKNGNNATYQNINPLSFHSIHNSYLARGAVPTNPIPQQNNDNSNPISCSNNNYYFQGAQQIFYFNLISQSYSNTTMNNCSINHMPLPIAIPNNL